MEPIEISDFFEILKEDLEEIKHVEKIKETSDALMFWYGLNILQLPKEKVKNACQLQGRGERGIDFFYIDENKKEIIISQAEATKKLNPHAKFTSSVIKKLKSAISRLNNPYEIEEGDPIIEIVKDYNHYCRKNFKVRLIGLISGIPTSGRGSLQEEFSNFKNELQKRYPNHSIELIDSGKLLKKYCEIIERAEYPNIEIELDESHKSIKKFAEDTLIVDLPGREIAKVVKERNLSLFEKNARLPLLKSRINEEIAQQLKTPEGRRKFWYLNNGITMVCKDFKVVNEKINGKRKKKIEIWGAQIVNGCQTSYTIFKHSKKLKDVFMLTRIIKTDNPEFAYEIRKGTNFQNAIKPRDLCSGDFIQLRLQREFEKLGYYYERKRNEWKVWKKYIPWQLQQDYPNRNLDNEKLAQIFLAWSGKPSETKEKKRKIFERSGFYNEIFSKKRRAEELLLPWLVKVDLYKNFEVGYKRKKVKRTLKYIVLTVGDLTLLALIGEIFRKKYRIHKNISKVKALVEIFENRESYRYFFKKYDKIVKELIQGLIGCAKILKKSKARGEEWDERELHRKYSEILRNKLIRVVVKKGIGELPEL